MQIERKSILTGKVQTREIPCTISEYTRWLHGMHIQDAMPNVSAEDREFVLTGITPEEWTAVFGNEEAMGEDA